MKTKSFLSFLLLLATCLVGSSVFCSCSKDDVEETPPAGSNTTDNKDPHEYVDLGLPSGTLWATCNVGASKPELYGCLFAWGETQQKTNYSWSTYKYCKGDKFSLTKYCSDNYYGTVDKKTQLEAMDDAATANWGNNWQMPCIEQFKELLDGFYTTTSWTTLNGLSGIIIISRSNGNRIFLPAAGYSYGQEVTYDGSKGYYWSSSIGDSKGEDEVIALKFSDDDIDWDGSYRSNGLSVRPVRVLKDKFITSIELNTTEIRLTPNESTQLMATIIPWYATNKNVRWESRNKSIATVDQTGKVTAVAVGNCIITCSATDGSGVKAECQVEVNELPHEYVDLGLPSGTLWAICNVGANSPEEYGDYFAWGETQPKSDNIYSLSAYRYYDYGYKVYTKYCLQSDYGTIDNKSELEMSDDAATVNWGSGWQMPSYEQLNELINSSYTTTTWTTLNGVNGRVIVSKSNGNSIFLPAAGYRRDSGLSRAGSYGNYWSRSLDTSNSGGACNLYFNSSSVSTYYYYGRYFGQSVRPVRVKK